MTTPDLLRPVYHLMPRENWMNDPNGLVHWKGWYHAFYQYNPHGPLWGNMSWGHARSRDLVHWEHLPVAMYPDVAGVDDDGCFSGAMVIHDGRPVIVYTGVSGGNELPCLAYPKDEELIEWEKDPANPVLSSTPDGLDVTIFRDHTLWRAGNAWRMGIGSGIVERGGAVLEYASENLRDWNYLHPFALEDAELNRPQVLISSGWECPDIFFDEGRPVMIICEWDIDPISVRAFTGIMEDGRLRADRKQVVDGGRCFYAPQSFQAEDGRRLQFGWLKETRTESELLHAGWAGCMTLPRVLSLNEHNDLCVAPADEVIALRQHELAPESDGTYRGRAVEIVVPVAADQDIEITVLGDEESGEKTSVTWLAATKSLLISTATSSLNPDAHGAIEDIGWLPNESLDGAELRVFVDHSVIEAYLGNCIAMSARAYPTSPNADRIVCPQSATVWQLGLG